MNYSVSQQQFQFPGLAIEILQASQDLVITPQEFSQTMRAIAEIASTAVVMAIIGMIVRVV